MQFSLRQAFLLDQIPLPVAQFLKRAFIIFIIWKLVYHIVLVPIRTPDKQLTEVTAASTAYLYRTLLDVPGVTYAQDLSDPNFPKSALFIAGKRSVGIADPCNGLELFVLYIGFIFCLPTTFTRQATFIVIGIVLIYISNVFRCLGLAYLHMNHYAMADFAHHYLFKMIIYAMIFYGWVLYSKSYFNHAS